MRLRGTLVLAGILVALLAYIYFAEERGTVRHEGGGESGGLLIPALSGPSGEVTALRWMSAAGTLSLARSDGGRWMVRIADRDVPCDSLQVEELLTLARRCRVVRVIPGDEIDAGRMNEFRLAPPSTTLTVTAGGVNHSIGLGAMSVARDLVYARRQGERDVLLADSSLLETLSATTSADLRQRRVIDWSVNDLRAVEVLGSDWGAFRAARKDVRHEWVASAPFEDFVDPLKMDSRLLPALLSLEVERFVLDGVADAELGRYGLDEPRYTFVFGGSDGPGAGARTVRIGKDLPDSPGTAYVMEVGLPFVLACRVGRVLGALSGKPGDLRDRNITRLGETPLVRVSVRYPPAEDFEFVHEHGEWRLEKPERQPLESRGMEDWLDVMRDESAIEFADGADPVATGLADPRGEMRFWAPGEGGEVELLRLQIGRIAPGDRGVFVRRTGAKWGALASVGLARLLRAGHFAVKALRIFPENWDKLEPKGIFQRTDSGERSHTFAGGRWSKGADVTAIEAIHLCFKRLAAVRWIGRASGREAEFGFTPTSPVVRLQVRDVTVRGNGKRVFGIMIGGKTGNGRFARAISDGRPGADIFLLTAADYRILTRSISLK